MATASALAFRCGPRPSRGPGRRAGRPSSAGRRRSRCGWCVSAARTPASARVVSTVTSGTHPSNVASSATRSVSTFWWSEKPVQMVLGSRVVAPPAALLAEGLLVVRSDLDAHPPSGAPRVSSVIGRSSSTCRGDPRMLPDSKADPSREVRRKPRPARPKRPAAVQPARAASDPQPRLHRQDHPRHGGRRRQARTDRRE